MPVFTKPITQGTMQADFAIVLDACVLANAGVSVIVTFNLKDFPEAALKSWKVAAVHPQDYLSALYSMNPGVVLTKVAEIATAHGEEMQDALMFTTAPTY